VSAGDADDHDDNDDDDDESPAEAAGCHAGRVLSPGSFEGG
jgi:hypothetical protein